MSTPTVPTPGHQALVALSAGEAEELAGLLGEVEDWLLHASPEVLGELASFLHQPPAGLATCWLVEDLGGWAVTLRRRLAADRTAR